jgi:hypothetical protein
VTTHEHFDKERYVHDHALRDALAVAARGNRALQLEDTALLLRDRVWTELDHAYRTGFIDGYLARRADDRVEGP